MLSNIVIIKHMLNAILLRIAFSFLGSREDNALSSNPGQTENQHTVSHTGDMPDHHAGYNVYDQNIFS